jgi:hypothetical protein
MVADQIRKIRARRARTDTTTAASAPAIYEKPSPPRRLLDLSCIPAAAAALLCIRGGIFWFSVFAFYIFVVQYVLFATAPRPAISRSEVISFVLAGVFFAQIPVFALTGAWATNERKMVEMQGRTISILQRLAIPPPTPTPTPK